MPHGMCLLWQPELMALHIISDLIIALSYFAIPIAIWTFLRRRPDLDVQHTVLAIFFSIFITACGLTHLMSILVLWQPYYPAEGVLKAVTALVSLATAATLPFLIPQLVRIPSPRVLAAEIEAHKSTLQQLQVARDQLVRRAALAEDGLGEANRRFQAALDGSAVTVFEQDENLRYTWVYNSPMDLNPSDIIGKTESDLFSPETASNLEQLKRSALEKSAPQRSDILVSRDDLSMWFDIRVTPVSIIGGARGIIASASDITSLKRQHEHLNAVMTELNHRSKNLLTIVVSIVRQTARVYDVQAEFITRLNERLTSLASTHDVLARQNWGGADLGALVEGQLKPYLLAHADRISVSGDPYVLPPEAAQYIAMAVHELGSNAAKYGALAGDTGGISVTWTVVKTGESAELVVSWVEEAARPSEPGRAGFGSKILTVLAPQALRGTARMDFTPAGLTWTLRAPANAAPPPPSPH